MNSLKVSCRYSVACLKYKTHVCTQSAFLMGPLHHLRAKADRTVIAAKPEATAVLQAPLTSRSTVVDRSSEASPSGDASPDSFSFQPPAVPAQAPVPAQQAKHALLQPRK